ncbi:heme lyase CcmF/NrfE family subunit [Sphingomonas sp. Leaf25]|uniref:heme lyase CcmF/NrfE family subunit n=1 Tax=Sphingomonas sp. Leaf25 TaxID=1735692 RepID=UPI0006F5EB03|nr:heme lyase CcmF/NrfE family subunit [Sphingomonas sp. Leaf25]KQN03937.1 cytochrome C biogenesis protein CcmF [Sphingomonas sp. Leaf25]
MIAEAGLAALWLAAAMALLQLAMAAIGLSARHDDPPPIAAQLLAAVRPVAMVQALLAAGAFAALLAVFARTDLSVLLVAENSHTAKPMLYKIAATWGNHEGSMLLWVTVLALAGGGIALFERLLAVRTHVATLGGQAAIALGFYAFLLFASNPFARLSPAAPEGLGLNPLLQDPGLAFHPPTLYLGYVGLSVAFSFAIGALVTRDVGRDFARAMRPWVLGAWVFLTIGITAGSYWAYYELGWGGWWFWDPVENASLMPWLAATALLHSVTVLATRDGLRAWTIMLAVVAFSMSMVGTFLVRSGILTSVHAFAVDPSRGSFILALLLLYIGGALALFGARIGTVRQGTLFDPVSREGALVLNNLLLSVILGIVLIGTLYPLVAQAFGVQLSVGPPFFNKAAGPVALALVAATALGPSLRWRRDKGRAVARRMALPGGAALLALLALVVLSDAGVLPVLGLSLAAGLAVASILPIAARVPWRTPLFTWGMVVAHFGVAVSLAGMAADSAFTAERLVAASPGTTTAIGPFAIRFDGIKPVVGPNWSAVQGRLVATRGDGAPFVLRPEQRFFANPPTETSEAAITTFADGQLYVVLGRGDGAGRRQLRLWWKPFVTLIWAGGGLIALGGLLSLVGRVRRRRRPVPRERYA